MPLTRATCRRRFRAWRGIGAALPLAGSERFDREHARLLERITRAGEFRVRHRPDARAFRPNVLSVKAIVETAELARA